MTTGLPDFFHYNLWANLRLLDFCAQLHDTQLDVPTKGTYGSVRQTLMHLFSSEEGYAGSITGQRAAPALAEEDPFPGFDELRRRAEQSGQALIRVAEQEHLDRMLHLHRGTYDASVMIVLIQAINHGIDHRSQIATLLSQQDIALPTNFLDGWAYNDAMR